MYYIVWFNDIIILAPDLDYIAYMKAILFDAYEIRDLGELHDYLGLHITCNRVTCTMHIDQHAYHTKILRKYHLDNCIPITVLTMNTIAL